MVNEEIARADDKVVKALLEHLTAAFEEFCENAEEPVKFLDAFMGVHNFHVVVVLDIEKRLNAKPDQQLFWRKVAADTFQRAMENKPAFRKG